MLQKTLQQNFDQRLLQHRVLLFAKKATTRCKNLNYRDQQVKLARTDGCRVKSGHTGWRPCKSLVYKSCWPLSSKAHRGTSIQFVSPLSSIVAPTSLLSVRLYRTCLSSTYSTQSPLRKCCDSLHARAMVNCLPNQPNSKIGFFVQLVFYFAHYNVHVSVTSTFAASQGCPSSSVSSSYSALLLSSRRRPYASLHLFAHGRPATLRYNSRLMKRSISPQKRNDIGVFVRIFTRNNTHCLCVQLNCTRNRTI